MTFLAFQDLKVGRLFASRPVSRVARGRVVLNNLSGDIRECLQHAEDCARKAAAQTDPKVKQDFLDLEQRWLSLARSYEFTERIGDFSNETKRKLDKLPKA